MWAIALGGALSCGETDPDFAAVEKSLASILAAVSGTSGDVQVKRATQGVWEPATTATAVYPGDWLRTGRGAWARLDFLNGSAIEMDEEAVLVVEALEPLDGGGPDLPASAPLVAIESGSIRSSLTDRTGKARPLFLRTADGARARVERKAEAGPAELRVARVDDTTEVSVSRGEVRLATANHEEVVPMGAGASLGKQGPKKVTLLAPPQLDSPAPEARLLFVKGTPVPLVWQSVEGATLYRAQVANDATFRRIAFARDLNGSTVDSPLERAGAYWWRVAARDGRGRQSLFGPARRFFLEKEAPVESLLEPKDKSAWGYGSAPPRIAFSWRPREGVKAYRLVIGKTADLSSSVITSEVVGAPAAQVDSLVPGEYFWGVFVQGASLEPLFLAPRRFTVKKVAGSNLVVPKKIRKWGEQ